MKWLKTIGAFFVALVGGFFVYQHTKHRRAQGQLEKEAAMLESEKAQEVAGAQRARASADKHREKADSALKNAQKRIDKLKEKGHATLADRVDALNQRLRDD